MLGIAALRLIWVWDRTPGGVEEGVKDRWRPEGAGGTTTDEPQWFWDNFPRA